MFTKENYSLDLNNVLKVLPQMLKTYPNLKVSFDYLLLSILENDKSDAFKILINHLTSIDIDNITENLKIKLKQLSYLTNPNKKSKLLPEVVEAIDETIEKYGNKSTSADLILFLLENNGEISYLFNEYGLNNEMFEKSLNEVRSDEEINISKLKTQIVNKNRDIVTHSGRTINSKKNKQTFIATYTKNLNDLAEMGMVDDLIGREGEIDSIIRVLNRRNKNNVILVGNGGVGKTALVKGLATLINKKKLNDTINDKIILEIDVTALIAGTQFRGILEDRVKGLFDEVKESPNYILFIDDIHRVLNEKNNQDLSSMIDIALNDINTQLIATTNFKDYRNTIESNPSLKRQFQKIIVEPTSIDESINILNKNKVYYEIFHNVFYTNEVIEHTVLLANKYITERCLPDSAFDIIDEVGANKKIVPLDDTISLYNDDISILYNKLAIAEYNLDYIVMDNITKEINKVKNKINKRKKELSKNEEIVYITIEDIDQIISSITKIPINKLNVDELSELANIDCLLKKDIFGQDEAIDKITRAIKRNRLGIKGVKKASTFMMIGETGVGKSFMAKKLAKEIFGDESFLVRLDMSEYSEKHTISKLIGSPPGYIGYDSGGQLTEIIKHKKYCVILFDEIEKACPEIFNLLLQLLDEGRLTDSSGQTIDFSHTIIILTSNVGSREASVKGNGIGYIQNINNKQRIFENELKKVFPPEFINRIDDIIYFNKLEENELKLIINNKLLLLQKNLLKSNYNFSFDDEVINYLYKGIESQKEYGARPIDRIIQTEVENKIVDDIIINNKNSFKFYIENNIINLI